jgi:hypothetical protein
MDMRLQPAQKVRSRARLIAAGVVTLAVVISLAAGPALADTELLKGSSGYGYQPVQSSGYGDNGPLGLKNTGNGND